MGDSLVEDRARSRLRRLFDEGGDDADSAGLDPSPLPAGSLEPAAQRWRTRRRRAGTQWQAIKTHRHPSIPPVPPAPAPVVTTTDASTTAAAVSTPSPPTTAVLPTTAAPGRSRLGIDPRFRQRRIAVKREEGRRRLRVLVAVTSVLVVIAVVLGALRSPWFAVRHVRVVGAAQTPVAAVVAAARLESHPLLINVSARRMDAAIERLPWVLRAVVHTSWPDAVTVSVVERRAVARIDSAAGPMLVDATGRVLGAAPVTATEPVIAVDGGSPPVPAPLAPEAAFNVAAVYAPGLAVAAAMPAALIPKVARVIVVPSTHTVGLQLVGGAAAVLGDTSEMPAKLTAVLTLVERVRIGSATIDATVPTAPVLTKA